MTERNLRIFLYDIHTHIDAVEGFIQGMDYETYCTNQTIRFAVERAIEVIGEAASNIPDDFRKEHPEVPWKKLVGIRNIIIHAYHRIDDATIWSVVNEELPDIGRKVKEILDNLEG